MANAKNQTQYSNEAAYYERKDRLFRYQLG